jgi:predicted nucleotidyltransferase
LSRPRFLNKKAIILSLRNIAKEIAQSEKKIEKIYLFGSLSTNDAGLRSDADILIVLKEDNRRMLDRIDEYLIKFSDSPVPVDPFVYTKEEVKRAIKEGNSFIRMALKGIKLTG